MEMSIKKIGIIIMIFSTMVLIGCNKDVGRETEDEILKGSKEKVEKEQDEEGVGIPSPISGLYALEEKVKRRPMAIMFDNHPKARWQSGISQAEIVYEYLVEAPYTRYMGIFLINDPESIGPIRSARPYFISSLLEYDPIYVRVGGSPQAKDDVLAFNIDDIDGLVAPKVVLWRNTKVNKKSPHNTYTSMEALRAYQKENGYKETGDYVGFKFNDGDRDLEGFDANKVIINYNSQNTTSYIYDPKEKEYSREKDGQLHIDELDHSPIRVKNIIIQEAETKIIDDSGRLFIDVIGEGRGKYITNGKVVDIKWVKQSRSNKTYYHDENGREIIFNPGATWIQVVKPDTIIDIE